MTITLALTLLLAAPAAAPAATRPAAESKAVRASDAAFRKLSDDEYAWRRTLNGPDEDAPASQNAALPDVGPAAQAAMTKRWTETMAALDRIDPAKLSPQARDDYTVYRGQISALLAEQQYR